MSASRFQPRFGGYVVANDPLPEPVRQSACSRACRATGRQPPDGGPALADADQCAPPGIDSASAVPTNLASAAAGPGEDKYTTPTVAPLDTIRTDTPNLGTPGVLTVGTLSDAPPSICINSGGQFTGFDNELLRAVAEKLGLRINFVGTEFSGLLAQVASRRFDVGSSSITTTDARRRTVGFTNG